MEKKLGVKFGSQFAAQFQVVSNRLQAANTRQKFETVAKEVGADLTDPEQFRIVQELARQR